VPATSEGKNGKRWKGLFCLERPNTVRFLNGLALHEKSGNSAFYVCSTFSAYVCVSLCTLR
jgi:hypothetical protein